MVQQHVVGYRLRKAKQSYSKCSLDVANAFYSPHHSSLDAAVACVASTEDCSLVQQRYRNASVCVPARDEYACVYPRSGALQGGTSASQIS